MGPNFIKKYPLDRTGSASTNLVENEAHKVGVQYNRIVAPNAGPYYEDSMVVYDAQGNLLKKGTDWKPILPYVDASIELNKPVSNMLVIQNKDITDVVLRSYQVPGGLYQTYNDAIIKLINSLMQDTRSVKWDDIVGKPKRFKPTPHLHHLSDIYGFEYEVLALEEILRAIQHGDMASHDVIYDHIENLRLWVQNEIKKLGDQTSDLYKQVERLDGRIDAVIADLNRLLAALDAHKADYNNPHRTTKTQVGLGLVENYGIATTQEVIAAAATNKYLVPAHLKIYLDNGIVPVINQHLGDYNNPHRVTKAQVGLSYVQNYAIATEQQARDGGLDSVYMTPLKTAQSIDQQFANRRAWSGTNSGNVGKYVSPDGNGYTRVGSILAFLDNAGERSRLYWDGGSLNCSTNMNVNDIYIRSDVRVKDGVVYLSETGEEVTTRLRELAQYVAHYFLKSDEKRNRQIGTIAQGYLKTFPEALITDEVTGILSIRPGSTNSILLKGWLEHDARLLAIEEALAAAGLMGA